MATSTLINSSVNSATTPISSSLCSTRTRVMWRRPTCTICKWLIIMQEADTSWFCLVRDGSVNMTRLICWICSWRPRAASPTPCRALRSPTWRLTPPSSPSSTTKCFNPSTQCNVNFSQGGGGANCNWARLELNTRQLVNCNRRHLMRVHQVSAIFELNSTLGVAINDFHVRVVSFQGECRLQWVRTPPCHAKKKMTTPESSSSIRRQSVKYGSSSHSSFASWLSPPSAVKFMAMSRVVSRKAGWLEKTHVVKHTHIT